MTSVLLIGGCGYIGSALFEHLRARSFAVDTVDLEWFGNASNRDNMKRDYRGLSEREIAQYEALVLLAGHSSVAMCSSGVTASFKNNVDNFVALLAKLAPEQKLIYASSASVYGNGAISSATEQARESRPLSHYDLQKQEIDHYATLSGLNYYGLRFGTVCGASANLRTDLMLNRMYETARARSIIEVFHRDASRPILGMSDLVRAIETILVSPPAPGVYNLASFNDTVAAIAEDAGRVLGVPVLNRERTDVQYSMSMSTTKFTDVFGFTFVETVESILRDVDASYPSALKSNRHDFFPYA